MKVQSAPEQRQQFLVDSFLTMVGSFPLMESDSVVYVLYRGTAFEVFLAGDANEWNTKNSPLRRLATTNLWYRSEHFEADARLDYKLIVDDDWLLDPRNPLTAPGSLGPRSELRMPGYVPPAEIVYRTNVQHGSLIDTKYDSPVLHNSRTAQIYLPPGYHDSGNSYPLLLFHDGPDYLSLAHTATVLDNLISEHRIPSVIAVFLPAVNRAEEYAGSQMDDFCSFVVDVVISAVDSNYRTRKDPAARAVMGSSNGGNISLYMAMKYPTVFGNVGGQSSNIETAVEQGFRDGPALPLRVYLDLGTYDIEVLLPRVRSFIPLLQNRGYDYLYQEFHEGHSWGNWRARIDDMLQYFFADLVSVEHPSPGLGVSLILDAPHPNPAHAHTTIRAEFPGASHPSMKLIDSNGRLIRTIWNGPVDPGVRHFDIDVHALRPGIYFLALETNSGRAVRRLLVL